jgi:hypothetical protein
MVHFNHAGPQTGFCIDQDSRQKYDPGSQIFSGLFIARNAVRTDAQNGKRENKNQKCISTGSLVIKEQVACQQNGLPQPRVMESIIKTEQYSKKQDELPGMIRHLPPRVWYCKTGIACRQLSYVVYVSSDAENMI